MKSVELYVANKKYIKHYIIENYQKNGKKIIRQVEAEKTSGITLLYNWRHKASTVSLFFRKDKLIRNT